MSSPSTFENRSLVTVTCGLSIAKSRTNAAASSSDRSTRVRGGRVRGIVSRKKYGSL